MTLSAKSSVEKSGLKRQKEARLSFSSLIVKTVVLLFDSDIFPL